MNEPLSFSEWCYKVDIETQYQRFYDEYVDRGSKGGAIYYFACHHIGLDVYMVKLRPRGKVDSWIVDQFETHSIFGESDDPENHPFSPTAIR